MNDELDRGAIERADFVFPEPPLGLTDLEAEWVRWYVVTNDKETATKLALKTNTDIPQSKAARVRWGKVLRKPAARAYAHEIRILLYRRSLLTVEDLLVELEAIALDPSMKVKYRLRALDQVRRILMPAKHQHVHLGTTNLTSTTGLSEGEANKSVALPPAQKPGLRGLTLEQIGAVRQTLLGITSATIPGDIYDPPVPEIAPPAIEGKVVEPGRVRIERERIGTEAIEVLRSEKERSREQERREATTAEEREHRRRLTDDFRRRLLESSDLSEDGARDSGTSTEDD